MRPFLALFVAAVVAAVASIAGAGEYPQAEQVITLDSGSPCVDGVCSTDHVHAVPVYAEAVPVYVAPVRSPRKVVNNVTVINAGSAQADAEVMASTGRLRHQGNNGGCREGIGYSTRSADDAIRRCCFYGRYRAREIGVARGARGWYACIRYE